MPTLPPRSWPVAQACLFITGMLVFTLLGLSHLTKGEFAQEVGVLPPFVGSFFCWLKIRSFSQEDFNTPAQRIL